MSTSPYSIDLYEKVIKNIESGKSQQSASKAFSLNSSTVSMWWLRYKREGNYATRKRPGKAPWASASLVQDYVKTHSNFTIALLTKKFK